jgi:EAL domain-containing protein (putative c-di-GMP-specific phosphodiesterase class I)
VPLAGGLPVGSLQRLRRHGVQLSLDDFGTGHSSLAVLQLCPVDEVKLDRSFLAGSLAPGEPGVATAVAALGGALRLRAVAEGVEAAEQALRLHELGYRLAQGYHFGRPMAAERFTALIEAGTEPARPAAAA